MGRGPDLVFVHGFGANRSFWRNWAPSLAKTFTLHLLDCAGFGDSPSPAGPNLSPEAQGRELSRLLDAGAFGKTPVLIGHSLGAGITLLAASSCTVAKIRGVGVVSGAVYPQPFPPYIGLARRKGIGELLLLPLAPPRWALRLGLRGIVADPHTITSAQVEGYRFPLLSRARRSDVLQAARQIDPSAGARAVSDFARLGIPLLALWGDADRVVPLRFAERLVSEVPTARLAVLPGVGHLPPEEAPDASREILADWIAALNRNSRARETARE